MNLHLPPREGADLTGFSQTFNPQDATVTFKIPAGKSTSAPALTVVSYVDADSDNLVVSVTPPNAAVTASLTSLHPEPTLNTKPHMDCYSYNTSADIIALDGNIIFHRNTFEYHDGYMYKTFTNNNIPFVDGFTDPLLNRSSGVILSKVPSSTSTTFSATLLTAQTETERDYRSALKKLAGDFVSSASEIDQFPPPSHVSWWAQKWASHYIDISSSSDDRNVKRDTAHITQTYILWRFIQLSQARSPYPIKFNGMLYIAQRAPRVESRKWGGLNWWQNARLPYYNMLTAGDSDELKSFLISYNKTVSIVKSRTQNYFGFDDGMFFTEYNQVLYGTQHSMTYRESCSPNHSEPIWHADDVFNSYNYQGGLDLSLFIMDLYSYTNDTSLLNVPIEVVKFYENLWGNTSTGDATDSMVFYPTQVIETWQCPGWPADPYHCPTNDMPTVAGMHAVLEKLIRLPDSLASSEQKANWTKLKARVPPLPVIDDKYAPCANCIKGQIGPGQNETRNSENAELYAVHPYRLSTTGRADQNTLNLGKAAFAARVHKSDYGWNQNAMDAALLGDAASAVDMVTTRANTGPALGYRFPVFSPHEQDYEPSADHLSVFQNALQYMLIQQKDDEAQGVLLLPAWPCAWDVNFTLSAPQSTTIVGSVVNGTVDYKVTPASRAAAVSVAQCQ